MSSGKLVNIHATKRVRKKSWKKRDAGLTSVANHKLQISGHKEEMHHTNVSAVLDFTLHDKGIILMDTSQWISHFPFQQLPELCKIKVWSFLSQCDLGRCMLVCSEWYSLIQKPQLWSSIHFSGLPYSCLPRDRGGLKHSEPVCHYCFRKRVFSFGQFLSRIKPLVQEFQFCLDISHPTDQFSNIIEEFMSTAKLTYLTRADMNWKDSPTRAVLKNSHESMVDYMYRYRKHQRMFSRIFEQFVSLASNLTTLAMPFDWTDKNVDSLCNLTTLQNLILEKYGICNHIFKQDHVNRLTSHLTSLKKLFLEVWIPSCSANGIEACSIESSSLICLDLSQCRGFTLANIKTPNLLHLRVSRRPWDKGLLLRQSPYLPCLLSVLAAGAPRLRSVNGVLVESEQGQAPISKMSQLMDAICCCPQHAHINGIDL